MTIAETVLLETKSETVLVEKKEIKKLLELNEELENYFRNTIIPQIFIDSDLILRKFSPPANMHFKLTTVEVGKSVTDIAMLANIPGLIDNIKEVMTNNQDIEREVQASENRWFQMNLLPYIIRKQNLTNGVVITFVDITERILDKRQIEKAIADHETFIYSVSHDFRCPLANMVLLIELLRMGIAKEDKEETNLLIQKMDESARTMRNMINELTDIIKIGSREVDAPDPVDIKQILSEVKFTLKNQIYMSHAKIVTNFDVTELHFSKKNVRSILYNLLSNAMKYVVEGRTPEIFIKTQNSGDFTVLSVADNGIGIEAEKQKEIFSIFKRLRPEVEGTGIGLFIVNKMVTSQGGKIEVESAPNAGTTFTIYFKNKMD